MLHQVEVLGQGTGTPWPIEGVATYVHGGLSVRHFRFRCTSTRNNGSGLNWSSKNAVLDKTQVAVVNGIDLDFGTNPSAADAGIYVCQDVFTSDRAELNITDSKYLGCLDLTTNQLPRNVKPGHYESIMIINCIP